MLYPKNTVIISNMDGLEWKRKKYSKPVRFFLKYAERLSVKFSQYFIADSIAMHSYLKNKYNIHCEYIAYGAEIFTEEKEELLAQYNLYPKDYFMLMAQSTVKSLVSDNIVDSVPTTTGDPCPAPKLLRSVVTVE